jgi:hypothetical protein
MKISTSVARASETTAALRSSAPTCGPDHLQPADGDRRVDALEDAFDLRADLVRALTLWGAAGGSRTSRDGTSKFCTCTSSNPAFSRPGVAPTSGRASPVNLASTVMPPVKSTPRLRPRVKSAASEKVHEQAAADTAYHSLPAAQ